MYVKKITLYYNLMVQTYVFMYDYDVSDSFY